MLSFFLYKQYFSSSRPRGVEEWSVVAYTWASEALVYAVVAACFFTK